MAPNLRSIINSIEIQGLTLKPFVKPPGSSKTHFLAGAGTRGFFNLIVFTVPHVYFEESAVQHLAGKWKGKTADELAASEDFYHDVITGPFEKLVRVATLRSVPGMGVASAVSKTCTTFWKDMGMDAEAGKGALEKFREVFKSRTMRPNNYVYYTLHPSGSVTIAFSEDETIPESGEAVIQSEALSIGIMGSMLSKRAGPTALRATVASRMAEALKVC